MLRILVALIALACAVPADAAPSRASSRIRAYQGRFEPLVAGATFGLWPVWSAGALAVCASVLAYRP